MNDHILDDKRRARRRVAASAALSVALHAVLVAIATLIVVPVPTTRDLVLISLLPAGGDGGPAEPPPGKAAQSTTGAASPAQSVAPAPAVAPPRTARHPRRGARRMIRQRHQALAAAAAPAEPVREPPAAVPEKAAAGNAHSIGATAAATGPAGAANAGAPLGVGLAGGHGGAAGGGNGLDQRPRCVYCPEPSYPLIARDRGWQGTVDIALLVLADGSVNAASLRRSSGHGALDRAALAVARQSRFTPPGAQGLPIPLHGRIEYRFQLSNAQ